MESPPEEKEKKCPNEENEKSPDENEEKCPDEEKQERPEEKEGKGNPSADGSSQHTLVKNTYEGTCQLCKANVETEDDLLTLSSCLHVLCRNCLQNTIRSQRDQIQVACPISETGTKCAEFLADFEVKLCVPPEIYVEYLDKSVEIAKKGLDNVASCNSDKCDFWCEFDQGRKTFVCPKCTEINCIQCQAIHVGVDCETYKMSVEQGNLSKLERMLHKGRRTGWDKFINLFINKTTGHGDDHGNGFTGSLEAILESMEQLSLITNPFTFQCPICFDEDVPIGNGVILHECFHMFCKECLRHHIEHCEEAIVKCPYKEDDYSCACGLQPREIKALVSDEVHEKRLSRLAQLGESGIVNSFHCKTPDCPEWCEYEKGAISFKCSTCQKDNCIPCKAIHSGTCEDYKNSIQQNENDKLSLAAVEKLIEEGLAMRCPKCHIPVQKMQGCDWLQCLACRTEICWVTKGPRWGPNGSRDTSGGCKCGVVNKCHPNCGNCH